VPVSTPAAERPLRIAHVGPVATSTPPPLSGSVETMTSLLTEGLVARGHDVTLFATGDSRTSARLHAIYPVGYWHDENMWPWELYEMLNLAAAVERARDFDLIHYEAAYYPMSLAFTRTCPIPILQTLHHSPSSAEVALWSRYPEAPFVAISQEQARLLDGGRQVEHLVELPRPHVLVVPIADGIDRVELSGRARVAGREQGHVVPARDQPLGEQRGHGLDRAGKRGRRGGGDRSDVRDAQRMLRGGRAARPRWSPSSSTDGRPMTSGRPSSPTGSGRTSSCYLGGTWSGSPGT
jgi:hypothetical protein